ncbi:hypothetical protein NA57DRAFT_45136 [Rhizodiscina lignyota]|uniref:Uncharacterized protein n=1 Tax=Rhizodiscina lignyota TaxID=1504668 RepID=A0A9P4I4Q3_9PEZI|nr:hypothetical protein NA57DRAFT_45136 [Rhizodiscina lignyota]
METIDQIASAKPRNDLLLSKLAELDYAPMALKQQIAFIADLESTLGQTDNNIKNLKESVQKELKDHEKYRDSNVKRFAYKLGGKRDKFEEKAAKEAREYFDAVVALKAAEDERTVLAKQIADAKSWKADIENAAETHRKAQEELNELYQGIFAGPTPEFPEEDAKEYPVYDAERKRNHLQIMLSRCLQAVDCLSQAQASMATALHEMGSTLDMSTVDKWGGGLLIDVAERHYLSKASSAAGIAVAQVEQASRLDTTIYPLPKPEIAEENLLSDVVFDNIFSDIHFHHKLEQSNANLERSAADIAAQLKRGSDRVADLRGSIEIAEVELKNARVELQRVRQEAFAKVAAITPPYPSSDSSTIMPMPSF